MPQNKSDAEKCGRAALLVTETKKNGIGEPCNGVV